MKDNDVYLEEEIEGKIEEWWYLFGRRKRRKKGKGSKWKKIDVYLEEE